MTKATSGSSRRPAGLACGKKHRVSAAGAVGGGGRQPASSLPERAVGSPSLSTQIPRAGRCRPTRSGRAKWPQTLTAVVTFAQAACPCLDGRPQAGVAGDVTGPPSLLGARPTGGRALRPLCPRGPAFLTVHCCRRGHRGPVKTPPVMGAGRTHATPQDPCPWDAGCQLPREGTPWWWALVPRANSRNSQCLRPGRSSGAAPQEGPVLDAAGPQWEARVTAPDATVAMSPLVSGVRVGCHVRAA